MMFTFDFLILSNDDSEKPSEIEFSDITMSRLGCAGLSGDEDILGIFYDDLSVKLLRLQASWATGCGSISG